MRIALTVVVIFFSCFAFGVSLHAEPVAGYWLTRTDSSLLPSSIIHLQVDTTGKVIGRVVAGFYEDNMPIPSKTCRKCNKKTVEGRFGLKKNQDIVGSFSVWGFNRVNAELWTGGKVVRVKTGQLLNADLMLQDPRVLTVKVYYGIFSRRLFWERLSPDDVRLICNGNVSGITTNQHVVSFCAVDLPAEDLPNQVNVDV
jgi:hypothetical protein